VRIFHESFRDFLIHPDPEDVYEFFIDEKVTHKKLELPSVVREAALECLVAKTRLGAAYTS
jgi:hypothetical protein